jgi:hypothetical protein
MFKLLLKIAFERNQNYHKDYYNHMFALIIRNCREQFINVKIIIKRVLIF